MNQPVLSIDVSKSYSYAKPFVAYQKPYSKLFSFKHTYANASDVINLLLALEVKTGVKPLIVMEATGNFSKPIKSFFLKVVIM